MAVISFRYFRAVLVFAIAGCFSAYQFMLQGATAVMVPQLIDGLNLDLAEVGLLTSSMLYIYLLFQLPGGYIADRFSIRMLLVCCNLLMALACYWFSVADSMVEASIARGLMGMATSPAIVICMNLASRWFPERWFCGMSGIVEAFALAGGAFGPILLPMLMAHCGWRGAMLCMIIPGCVLALASLFWIRNYPPDFIQDNQSITINACVPGNSDFSRWQYMLNCAFGFGLFSLISCFGGLWGIPFLSERFPGQDETVAVAVSFIFIGAGLGAPCLGFIAGVLRRERLVMTLSIIAGIICTLMVLFCRCPLSMITLMCFVAGFFCGGYMLVFGRVKAMGGNGTQGILLAGANGSMLLAGPLMQPLIGWILDRQEKLNGVLTLADYQFALTPILVSQLIALLAILILPRH